MARATVRISALCPLGVLLWASGAPSMTIEIAGGGATFIRPGDVWKYFEGTADPPAGWNGRGFDDSSWPSGPSGFGYGDSDDATVLDMQNKYVTLYIRKTFTAAEPGDETLELTIDYDDGFIAYLNGAEVARRQMPAGAPNRSTTAASHEAGTPETIALGKARDLLAPGENVIAIEGHNASIDSGDFSLIPSLGTASDLVRDGTSWIVGSDVVTLRGTTSSAAAVTVRIAGAPAAYEPASRSFEGTATLSPGRNEILVEALDAGGAVVDQGSISIVYVPASARVRGVLPGDAVWSGACVVEEPLTVPAGATLEIHPGTIVMVKAGAGITVRGRLVAAGTEPEPVRFTHYGDGTRWERIIFVKADDSLFSHAVFEYSDSEGEHQDYYGTGSRTYHEAVVALGTHLDFLGCTFWKLPDESAAAEGDATAIISDDPDEPGVSSATFTGCRFLDIGQGIHTRFAHVRVEECFFQGKRGDNDDVDLWGESDPPPLILHNFFAMPVHEDRINPTRCSAIIVGNILMGSTDHGIVLRDKGSPIVMNNVVRNCPSGGIAIENSCTALLVNNTIDGCGRGLRLFDLGRWGPPYNLNPGGGTATAINCIIRNCTQAATLEDSSNTTIPDRGSHLTVIRSNVQGGRNAISVSGSASTVTWGEGNIDADPLFVDRAAGDYHLKPGSPSIDTGTADQAPPADLDGVPRPQGAGYDMGAYEYAEILPVRFARGDANSDGGTDVADAVTILLALFSGGGVPCLDAADADDLGTVELTDAIYLLRYLFLAGAPPPAPAACGFDETADALGCESFPPCEG